MIRIVLGRVLKTVSIALIGCLVLSRAYHTFANSVAASDYQARSGAESSGYLRAEYEKAETYNRNLLEQPQQDFGQERDDPGGVYSGLLNVGSDGVMAVLSIPEIGLRLPVYHGVTDRTMEKGCGHLRGTSLPVGGCGTHAVIFGHRGLPDSKLFTDLDRLKKGDVFTIRVLDRVLCYRVSASKVILPDETDDLKIRPGKDLVTLVTCTPYGINTHRLLVFGERTDGPDSPARIRKRRSPAENLYMFFLQPPVVYGMAVCDLVLSVLFLRRIWLGPPGGECRKKQLRQRRNMKGKECADPGGDSRVPRVR